MIMSSFSPIEVSPIITMLPGGRDAGGTRNDGRGEQTAVRDPAGDRTQDPPATGGRARGSIGASDPTPGAGDSAGRPSGHWTPAAGPGVESSTRRRAQAARVGPLPSPLCGLRPDPRPGEAGRVSSPPAGARDAAAVAAGSRTVDGPAAGGRGPP